MLFINKLNCTHKHPTKWGMINSTLWGSKDVLIKDNNSAHGLIWMDENFMKT